MAGSGLRQPHTAVTMTTNGSKENVILLHGLARTKFSMARLATELANDYHLINHTYPSRKYSIEELARLAIKPALARCNKNQPVHFVTHSLGGILVRQYLSEHDIPNLGHVVMLGPPNHGSEIVDFFKQSPFLQTLFYAANGPAGKQLGTDQTSKPNSLGEVKFPLGVVAGNKSFNLLLSMFLPTEGDGKVTVESSKVQGMIDHLILPVDHTFMMRDPTVIRQVKAFLQNGFFDHNR